MVSVRGILDRPNVCTKRMSFHTGGKKCNGICKDFVRRVHECFGEAIHAICGRVGDCIKRPHVEEGLCNEETAWVSEGTKYVFF